MKNKLRSREQKAAALIEEYFEEPYPETDLEEFFGRVNRAAARSALIERLRDGNVDFFDLEPFITLFQFFDFAGQVDALRAIAGDRSQDEERRALAVALLEEHESGSGMAALVDFDDRLRIMKVIWRGLIYFAMETADMVEAATRPLLDAAAENDQKFFRFFDDVRRQCGAPAALIYADVLGDPAAAPLHEAMLESLVAEPSVGSIEVAETLVAKVPVEASERLYRAALMRLRTALASAPASTRESGGSLSPLDRGSGILRFWYRAPGGHRVSTTIDFLIGGKVRVPMTTSRIPDETFEAATDPDAADVGFARAASAFLTLLTSRDEGLDRSALAIAKTIREVVPLPAAAPTPSVAHDELADLLDREEYDSWYLPELGTPEEIVGANDRELKRMVKETGRDKEIARQLQWMCDYMSRWHFARGEERESAIMARLAVDLKKNFARSPLLELLAQRTIAMAPEHVEDFQDDDEFEDDPAVDQLIELTRKVIGQQLRLNNPPFVHTTLDRLKSLGYSDEEAKMLMAEALAVEIATSLGHKKKYDERSYRKRLDALPDLTE